MKFFSRAASFGAALGLILIGAMAQAVVGTPPTPGGSFALIDQTWLNGLAGGSNNTFQSSITAHAGGTQAAALVLNPNVNLVEVDTVATTGDSVALPQCVAGTYLFMANAGSGTLDVYGNPTTNAASGTLDTINGTAGTSAYTLTTNTNAVFFCAKNGAWKAGKIS